MKNKIKDVKNILKTTILLKKTLLVVESGSGKPNSDPDPHKTTVTRYRYNVPSQSFLFAVNKPKASEGSAGVAATAGRGEASQAAAVFKLSSKIKS